MSDFLPVPPTNAVADPQTRAVLDALAHNSRVSSEVFVARDDVASATSQALTEILGGGLPGSSTRPNAAAIDLLADAITNTRLYNLLGERIAADLNSVTRSADEANARLSTLVQGLDSGITAINNVTSTSTSASARSLSAVNATVNHPTTGLAAAQAAIIAINNVSATSTSANATSLYSLQSTVNHPTTGLAAATSGLSTESSTRATRDDALAAAVNNIWGKIGGSTAAITDSALAAVNPSAAAATKWNQVVAAVTDPNTGAVNSASIVQELDTYANSADSTFNASYSVRAQTSVGGQTVVGGFGLMATAGAGSAAGASIDFGVRADKFYVAATSGTPTLTAQLASTDNTVPFIITTTTQTIGGVTYTPGVYIKKAVIADASIDTAKITQHINSTNFNGTFDASSNIASDGTAGWAIDKSGYAVFSNVRIRGTSSVERLVVTGIVYGSITVPNNGVATVTHNTGRKVTVTVWSAGTSEVAYISNLTDTTFDIRLVFSGGNTAYYSYF